MSLHNTGITVGLAKADPTLSSFGVVIIDEAHEHSCDADLLLGHLKSLLGERDNLKVIVMSATIDTALFTRYFPQAVVKEVSGRQHEVVVKYLREPPSNLIAAIINTIVHIHSREMPGDILVFVSGKNQINKVIDGVRRAVPRDTGPLDLYTLHSNLPMREQTAAINADPPRPQYGKLGRKVIVSTNSAETSLTIGGVTHVIDSCKAKVKMWNPHTESWSLLEQPVSKASVTHRKGRAGRTSEGMAWLMCTERGYHEDLVEHSVPQVLQGDMLSGCLTILKLGHNPITFDYIVSPAPETIVKALGLLRQLGAVDCNGKLSSRGDKLASIPADVYVALTLLESPKYGCSDEIVSITAMLDATNGGSYLFQGQSGKKLDNIKKQFQHRSGDHITLFNIYMAWRAACIVGEERSFCKKNMLLEGALRRADRMRQDYLESMRKIKSWKHCEMKKDDKTYYSRILQALAAGHFLHAAKRVPSSNQYQLVRSGMDVSLSKDTNLGHQDEHNEWVIYNECWDDGLRVVSTIKSELLVAAQPGYWWDAEFLPQGHIKDGLLQTLAGMIGDGSLTPPVRQWADVGDSNWAGLARWVQRCAAPHNRLLQEKLPSWQSERNSRSAKVEQLKRWDLGTAISAGFDDGSSRYGHPRDYYDMAWSIARIEAHEQGLSWPL